MNNVWKFLTSLRLTVVCLALAIVLVFVGTVAQADEGLYQAQARYFKHWIVIGASMWGHHIPIVLPGGYTLGVTLLVNLLAAHIRRFKWSASKIGIHLTHAGIVVLLVGQLATDMLQVESRMTFNEGEGANYVEDHAANELVFLTDSGAGEDRVVAIPEALVRRGGEIADPALPFSVQVKDYHLNSDLATRQEVLGAATQLQAALATVDAEFATPASLAPQAERASAAEGRVLVWRDALAAVGEKDSADIVAAAKRVAANPAQAEKLCAELKARFHHAMLVRFMAQGGATRVAAEHISKGEAVTAESLPGAATQGAGPAVILTSLPEVRSMDMRNVPSTVIEIIEAGRSAGTWLVTPMLKPQEFQAAGRTFRVAMRSERRYVPFTLKLLQATQKKYPGSDTPKDFRSRVRIDNPGTNEHREVEISMNNPLRYSGLGFFQYQMTKDELDARPGSSVLQVVRNPSWLAPYIGCLLVAIGMLWQFLHHLVAFISKRRNA